MTILPILIHPDKRLRKTATPVETFDDSLKSIVDNMFATMYDAHGIGLAATQVDIHQRIVVMDIPADEATPDAPHGKHAFINPEIVERSEETAFGQEGCLSIPEQYADVERATHIRYRYQDTEGNTHEAEADGLLGVCMQHEIDHLNGVLFIDHLSRLKRERLEKKLAKWVKTQPL
ncbi:peptide deformylase [Suttonella sp. R2A3]|uniref:peptide deformylase n=1 Tax=Suttonella sp. R2A3 TaxID=2908648 RepID=UPI001F2A54F2|nr:peptide deformylase [Suttonella sp. R2A3]UJF24175.1 peptide deformylase [Suttonella sp. R2A3]